MDTQALLHGITLRQDLTESLEQCISLHHSKDLVGPLSKALALVQVSHSQSRDVTSATIRQVQR
eukprot:scaffold88141_cov24-Prasinocladus_malaysianus.AAC.1